MKQSTISEYEQQVLNFLAKHNISFACKFLEYSKYFPDDKENRDIYELTLSKDNKNISFKFGQSLHLSKPFSALSENDRKIRLNEAKRENKSLAELRKPRAYDLLASITKYSPGSFANFCSDFGYDEDSIKANNIYKTVCEEWFKVEAFFTDEQLEELRGIN